MQLSLFFQDSFIQMAFFASLLASIASGAMGSFVVVKRIVFIAGSIAHSILAGTSFCLWIQKTQGTTWPTPLEGAFAAAILSALILGWIHINYQQREDAVIAAIWSTGMAIGVIFLSITPGNTTEMMSFLFGNILWVTSKDLILLACLDLLILCAIALNYRKLIAICFDEEQALLQGIPVKRIYLFFLCIVSISIVLFIQIVGTILVIALLTIPATLASLFTKNFTAMMVAATFLSAIFSVFGLGASYVLDWPPGATIALLSALCYLIVLLMKNNKVWSRLKYRRS